MKTENEIRYIMRELSDSETPLDDHMQGYVNALKWVLEESPEA
jgi:hypothetical protein